MLPRIVSKRVVIEGRQQSHSVGTFEGEHGAVIVG